MFQAAIRSSILQATWAVFCTKRSADFLEQQHGSAFAINREGLLLTTWHQTLIDRTPENECEQILVSQPRINPDVFYEGVVVARDHGADMALLQIKEFKESTQPVEIYSGPNLTFGCSCALFGYPTASPGSGDLQKVFPRAAAGVVSLNLKMSRFKNTRLVDIYELDLQAWVGHSGGPVFLPTGEVIGIYSGSRTLPIADSGDKIWSGLAIAIAIHEGKELLASAGIEIPDLR